MWQTLNHPNIQSLHGLCWLRSEMPSMVSLWCAQGNINDYLKTLAGHCDSDVIRLKLVCMSNFLLIFRCRDSHRTSWLTC